mgnify:CR=1 FL=1
MRPRLIVGNWKMHGSLDAVNSLVTDLLAGLDSVPVANEVGICPTFVHLGYCRELLESSRIKLGAQNAHSQESGAFTGEVSAAMLAELGLSYVLVGHSERRQLFAETDQAVAEKFLAVQQQQLTPILCVGETLEQREQGITEQVVLAQIDAVIDQAGIGAFARAVIAYEPVWAIGTGKTASPEQAQEVHRVIREHLAQQDAEVAKAIQLLYGGSVKAANADELFRQADIDGGLVGGASLKADEFIAICSCAE